MPLNNNARPQYFSSSLHFFGQFGLFSFHLKSSHSVWCDQWKASWNCAVKQKPSQKDVMDNCEFAKLKKLVLWAFFAQVWYSECFHWQILVSWNLCCPFISATFSAKLPKIYFQMCKHFSHHITKIKAKRNLCPNQSHIKLPLGLGEFGSKG